MCDKNDRKIAASEFDIVFLMWLTVGGWRWCWNVQKETVNSHHKRYKHNIFYSFFAASFLLYSIFHLLSCTQHTDERRASRRVFVEQNYLGIIGLLLLFCIVPGSVILDKFKQFCRLDVCFVCSDVYRAPYREAYDYSIIGIAHESRRFY